MEQIFLQLKPDRVLPIAKNQITPQRQIGLGRKRLGDVKKNLA